jgi:hypothetical protein
MTDEELNAMVDKLNADYAALTDIGRMKKNGGSAHIRHHQTKAQSAAEASQPGDMYTI